MLPLRMPNSNCALGANQDEYMTLHCHRMLIRDGVYGYTSLWEFTQKEKYMLVEQGGWIWVGMPTGKDDYTPLAMRSLSKEEIEQAAADARLILTVMGAPHAPPICPTVASAAEVPFLKPLTFERAVLSFVAPAPVEA